MNRKYCGNLLITQKALCFFPNIVENFV